MEWMEVIRIQTTGEDKSSACGKYLRQMEDMEKMPGLTQIQHYYHASITGFQAIILKWDTAPLQVTESRTGIFVKHGLKEYGLVDHSIWIVPDPSKEQ